MKLYDGALRQTHTIKQVHPFLLSNLRFPSDLYLSSVGLLDSEVDKLRERLVNAYSKALIPLKAFAKTFIVHMELFKLDVPSCIELDRYVFCNSY